MSRTPGPLRLTCTAARERAASPIASWWPEFGAHGKDGATLRHLRTGELYFGVPEADLARIGRQVDDPTGKAVFATITDDWPLFKTAPRALFPDAGYANRPDLLTADIPFCATGSARAFARVHAALLDEVDGMRLVSADRLQQLSTPATSGPDLMTGGPSTWALGYSVGLPWQAAPQDNPFTFGMVGVGGSAAYADWSIGVSIAVTNNRFNPVSITAVEQVNELVRGQLG